MWEQGRRTMCVLAWMSMKQVMQLSKQVLHVLAEVFVLRIVEQHELIWTEAVLVVKKRTVFIALD